MEENNENIVQEEETIEETPAQEQKENVFTIPEEYKNKGWAKNIKSQADLFKAYDNATSLIGKKTIGIPDFDNASEEEINSFYSKLAPANIEEYDFGEIEIDEQTKEDFANIFKNNGINKKAGKNILNAYQQMIDKAMGTEEDLANELKERFGNSYNEEKEKELATMFSKYMTQEDRQIMAKMPVKVQALMCSFADNIKKSYGISLKSSVDNNSINEGFTKADYDREVLEMFKLDKEHKLTPAIRQEKLERLNNIRKSIKEW
ncbi:hypothetical protein J5751_04845 [bacterium]|nr:hypothetical protein [bacterium]